MDLARLLLIIAGDSAGALAAIGETRAALGDLEVSTSEAGGAAGLLRGAFMGLAAVGVVVAAASAVSLKMAADFQSQLELVRTQAHDTTDSLSWLQQQVLAVGAATGQGPDQLAEGLYHVTSVGYRGADAIEILTEAAKEASISGANLDDTTYSLTSTMNTFGLKAAQAHDTMAMLNAIVGAGDMRFQDLNGAISTGFLAAGETFGVTLQSMGAALAYLTDRGASAEESATRLKMTVTLLGAPTKQAAGILGDLGLSASEVTQRTSAMEEALKKSGVTTTQLSDDLRKPDGIQVALQDLVTHMQKAGLSADETAAVLSRAFGGGRSGAAIMSMVQHLDILKGKFDSIGGGAARFDQDWQDALSTFNVQWGRVRASLDAVAIEWGSQLLPVASAFMRLMADDIEPGAAAVASALDKVGHAARTMYDEMAKGRSGAQAVFSAAFHDLGLDPATAAMLSEKLGPTLERLWEGLRNVQAAFGSLFAGIKNGEPAVDILTGFFFQLGLSYGNATGLSKDLVNAWNTLVSTVKALWPVVSQLAGTFFSLAGTVAQQVMPVIQWLLDHGDLVKAVLVAWVGWLTTLKTIEFAKGAISAFNNIAQAAKDGVKAAKDAWQGLKDLTIWAQLYGEAALNFVKTSASAVAEAAKSAAAWVGAALKSAAEWAATQVKAAASFVATTASSVAEAGKTALAWLASAGKVALGWLATAGEAIGSYVATRAAANTNSNAAALVWLAGQAKVAAGWVATKVQAAISFAATAAEAVANGAKTAAAWVASGVETVASFVTTAASAGVNAAAAGASMVAGAATATAAWVAARVQTVASFVATAAAATAQTAIMIARFVLAQAAMLGIRVATIAWSVAQWALNVALDANPISLVILAVAALVAGIIWAYQNVGWFRNAVNDVWGALKSFASWIWGTLMGALDAIASKAQAVGNALNSINPFAQHSPSLVQNVTAGTAVISDQYDRMGQKIKAAAGSAALSLKNLTDPSNVSSITASTSLAVAGATAGSGGDSQASQLLTRMDRTNQILMAILRGKSNVNGFAAALRQG